MMPSPENIRLAIDTLTKRIEHKETQAAAIRQEATARTESLRIEAELSGRLDYAGAKGRQIGAILKEAEARCGLIELDIEQMKAEKVNAEKVLGLMTSNLIVPSNPMRQ